MNPATTAPAMGTDGIRGPYGSAVDESMAGRLARCLAAELPCGGECLVGRDTRASGPALAQAVAAGLALEGGRALDLGVVPTGLLAWEAARRGCHAVMVTASHNPPEHNGLKFLGPNGKMTDSELQAALRHWDALDDAAAQDDGSKLGAGRDVRDGQRPLGTDRGETSAPPAATDEIRERWLELLRPHLAALHPSEQPLRGRCIGVDAAHGAGGAYLPWVLEALGANVCALHAEPDPARINLDCGTENPDGLRQLVEERDCWLGFALDGDGDRLQIAAPDLGLLDGDHLLYLHALLSPKRAAGVGGTQMTNSGLAPALADLGIEFDRSPVGEGPLAAMLRRRGWWLGGEPSGHLLRLDLMPSCDGSSAAAVTAVLLAAADRPLDALLQGLRHFDSHLVNLRCADREATLDRIRERALALETRLGDGVRTLVRPSGTEPLIRVLVETREPGRAREMAQVLVKGLA